MSIYFDFFSQFRHAIAGVPGSESCQLRQGVPFEVRDWEKQEVADLRVMLQYLTDQVSLRNLVP